LMLRTVVNSLVLIKSSQKAISQLCYFAEANN